MKKTLNIVLVVLGVLFLFLAFVYWSTPANALPSYLPGYDPSMMTAHFKHGLAALILALAAFIFVWFNTGKKRSSKQQ